LLLCAISIFRLEQIQTADENLDYPSLRHYRNANSRRLTFDDALGEIVHTILATLYDARSSDSENENTTIQRGSRQTRSMKIRDLPLIRFTGLSPQRKVKDYYDNPKPRKADRTIVERRVNCPGNPVYRLFYDEKEKVTNSKGKGSRNSCVLCSSLTNIWCSLCHTWLCGPHIERGHEGKDAIVRLNASENICCKNTCWMMWHERGLYRIHKESVKESVAEVTDDEE